jgi:cysteine-rich repeat protein
MVDNFETPTDTKSKTSTHLSNQVVIGTLLGIFGTAGIASFLMAMLTGGINTNELTTYNIASTSGVSSPTIRFVQPAAPGSVAGGGGDVTLTVSTSEADAVKFAHRNSAENTSSFHFVPESDLTSNLTDDYEFTCICTGGGGRCNHSGWQPQNISYYFEPNRGIQGTSVWEPNAINAIQSEDSITNVTFKTLTTRFTDVTNIIPDTPGVKLTGHFCIEKGTGDPTNPCSSQSDCLGNDVCAAIWQGNTNFIQCTMAYDITTNEYWVETFGNDGSGSCSNPFVACGVELEVDTFSPFAYASEKDIDDDFSEDYTFACSCADGARCQLDSWQPQGLSYSPNAQAGVVETAVWEPSGNWAATFDRVDTIESVKFYEASTRFDSVSNISESQEAIHLAGTYCVRKGVIVPIPISRTVCNTQSDCSINEVCTDIWQGVPTSQTQCALAYDSNTNDFWVESYSFDGSASCSTPFKSCGVEMEVGLITSPFETDLSSNVRVTLNWDSTVVEDGTYDLRATAFNSVGDTGTAVSDIIISSTIAIPSCGDGIVNQTWEQCDDGNLERYDGCSEQCQSEENYFCGNYDYYDFRDCFGQPVTGVCAIYDFNDDGNVSLLDFSELGNVLNTCEPPAPICGNGIVEAGEQCDSPGDGTCTKQCRLSSGGGGCNITPVSGGGTGPTSGVPLAVLLLIIPIALSFTKKVLKREEVRVK